MRREITMRRFAGMVILALLLGCSGAPFEPSQVQVRTDRNAYADTSTLVLTVKLFGGGPIAVGGCPPPSVSFFDSTAQGTWEMNGASVGVICYRGIPSSTVHVAAGDSAVALIPLTGLAPGRHRAAVMFGPGGNPVGWVAMSNAFVVQ
jgi:hypothetical protein